MNAYYTPELQKYAPIFKGVCIEKKMLCLVKGYRNKYYHSISSEEHITIPIDEIKTKLKQL